MARSRNLDYFDDLLARGMWRCRVCKEERSLHDFHKDSSRRSGRSNLCKLCDGNRQKSYLTRIDRIAPSRVAARRERAREYNRESPEKARARKRLAKRVAPWDGVLQAGAARARNAGLPVAEISTWNLRDYLDLHGIDWRVSWYSGTVLTEENYSLDHVVPLSDPDSPGHVAANLRPCTRWENSMKGTRPESVFRALLQKLGKTPA